jgi:ubiquitin C-terminal hydrolase
MNAALQALAHAPELCHALDAECHLRKCPVAWRNERRRRKNTRTRNEGTVEEDEAKHRTHKTSISSNTTKDAKSSHHRRSNSSSSNGSAGSGSSSSKKRSKKHSGDASSTAGGGGGSLDTIPDYEYCTLCEVERLLGRIHSRPEEKVLVDDDDDYEQGDHQEQVAATSAMTPPQTSSGGGPSQDAPFVPEAFVSGFMSKVAPWFRRGVQEDSHEFLRLLIDAMQTSCKAARAETIRDNKKSVDNNDNITDNKARGTVFGNDDNEYPFRLFRGTVESRVKCSACQSTSCKIDPIEDIGLDILPVKHDDVVPGSSTINSYSSSSRGGGGGTLSRSTSPTSNLPLADVTQALERFISSEQLDSGYKCEKCGKLGKATKTSKLASIPPILTLHLKRFRYGSGGGVSGSKRGGGVGVGTAAGFYTENNNSGSTRSSSRSSARGGVGGSIPQVDFDNVGPSGSAKIEGHVGFAPVLDIKPYLTPQLQQTVFQKAICRLFAVVVHSGKNSHSGHYVSYVHNVTKKEWWMMDDAKVVRSTWEEVRNAEAYMLFYRVTSHPVAMQLKSIADKKEEKARRVMEEIRKRDRMARVATNEAEKANVAAISAVQHDPTDNKVSDAMPSSDNEETNGSFDADYYKVLGKRQHPDFASGEEWARVVTTLSSEYQPLFARIQEFIAENVTFSPEFFRFITEEYHRMSSKLSIGRRVKNNKRIRTLLGKGPRGVYPPEDVVGGAIDIQGGILDLFHQVSIMYKANNKGAGGSESIFLPKKDTTPMFTESFEEEVEEHQHTVPSSPELIIPSDNTETYDGAL